MPVSHLGLECVFGIKVNESSKDDSDIGQGWEPQFFLDAWKAGDPKKFWFLNLLVLKIGQNSAAVFILQTSNVMLNKTLTISEVFYIDLESWSCITYFTESKEAMSIITHLKLLFELLIMVMLCGSWQIQVLV